jgi:hypothetical protein
VLELWCFQQTRFHGHPTFGNPKSVLQFSVGFIFIIFRSLIGGFNHNRPHFCAMQHEPAQVAQPGVKPISVTYLVASFIFPVVVLLKFNADTTGEPGSGKQNPWVHFSWALFSLLLTAITCAGNIYTAYNKTGTWDKAVMLLQQVFLVHTALVVVPVCAIVVDSTKEGPVSFHGEVLAALFSVFLWAAILTVAFHAVGDVSFHKAWGPTIKLEATLFWSMYITVMCYAMGLFNRGFYVFVSVAHNFPFWVFHCIGIMKSKAVMHGTLVDGWSIVACIPVVVCGDVTFFRALSLLLGMCTWGYLAGSLDELSTVFQRDEQALMCLHVGLCMATVCLCLVGCVFTYDMVVDWATK